MASMAVIKERECKRCGKKWYPRRPDHEPQTCPGCKSAIWKVAKKQVA